MARKTPRIKNLTLTIGKYKHPRDLAGVGCARASDVANQHSEGLAVVGFSHTTDVPNQQLATVSAESQTAAGGGSIVVDCRHCPGGCCGGLSGRRLPRRVVELLRVVKVALGLRHECEVVNAFPELFCRRVVNRGVGVKGLERLLSRDVEYKASYVLGRLNECLNDAVCWRYLWLGVRGWFEAVHRLAGRSPVGFDDYFGRLVRGLGFSGVVELTRYLRLVGQGLVDFNYVNRSRGYRDVLSVRCRLCGRDINATGPLPGVLFTIVNHFRVEHGLARPKDIETKVKEIEEREAERLEGDDVGVKLLRHSAEVNQLVRLVVHRLMDVGLLERLGREYRCRVCNADVGGAVDALVHALNHHYDVVNRLLGGRPAPSVDGFNDAVDELASLFNSGNPDGVKPVVKALVRGIIDVLNVRGSISMLMLARELSESEDYRPLIDSLATGAIKADRVVAMIVEAMARHGLVQVNGEVVKVGE